jgi:hypothetical protein
VESPIDEPGSQRARASSADLAREKNYVRRIEKRFLALRESGLILSARDFEIVHDWFERGVPAELVIATLEEVYARTADRSEGRRIQSIAYCRRAVERAWEERRAALLGTAPGAGSGARRGGARPGAGSAFTKEQIAAHLAAVAKTTRSAAQGAVPGEGRANILLGEIAERLETLAAASSARGPAELPALEEELVALEERAVAVGRDILPAPELDEIGAKAARDIAGATSRMSTKARESMLRRAVDAAVRRRLGLPRYSLFTMTG